MVQHLFRFPDPANEVTARTVAAGVVAMGVLATIFDPTWLVAVMTYGFLARVASGPKLSPLGQLATRIVVPRLQFEEKLVSGPPKRFAQAIGLTFTATALGLTIGGENTAARVVLGMLVVAATLESAAGICLGCKGFAVLMRFGLIPETVCERCNDIWSRPQEKAEANA